MLPLMRAASHAYGTGEHWLEATKQALSRLEAVPHANVAFVYMTDYFSGAADEIRQVVMDDTGVTWVTGTTSLGVSCGVRELMDEAAVVVLLARIPSDAIHEVRSAGELASGKGGRVAFVNVDQLQAKAITSVPSFGGLFCVGAMTASRGPSVQLHSTGVTEDGLTGLVIDSDRVEIHTGLTQGCVPLGGQHRVTGVHGTVISSLDDRSPLDILREEAAEIIQDDLRRLAGSVFVGCALPNRDTDEFMVRNLLGVNASSGALAVAHPFRVGDLMCFVRRDLEAAKDDMRRMLERLIGRSRRPALFGLYYSCLARGRNLFGEPGVELTLIRDALGAVPVVGFYGNGEVSGTTVYGYTGVLALVYGAREASDT